MFEARTILRHAATVLVGQLAVMAFGIADTLIAGRYAASALAALSVGSSIYISIYVALNGLMQALLPVWSELRGADQKKALGRSVRQALYLCTFVSVLGTLALCFPDPWLEYTQVPDELQADVRAYLQILAIAVGPSLLFRMYATLNQSLGKPLWVTGLQIAALVIKIPLSMALTLGVGDLPAQGVVGCAWATLIVNFWLMCMSIFYLRHRPMYADYQIWKRLEAPHWPTLRQFLKLGVPSALSLMVEVTAFTMMALFISRQGIVASASHQIATSLATVLYMVPLSLGIASSARVGFWLGAHQAQHAEKAAHTGLKLALALALACCAVLAFFANPLAQLFSKDAAVVLGASAVLVWVAFYHLMDALQAVSVFILRCYRMTFLPLVIYTIMLWGVGLYGAYVWAYQGFAMWPAKPGVITFWATSSFALGMVSVAFVSLVLWTAKQRRLEMTY
jgi:MATE family multidrug resistance protein